MAFTPAQVRELKAKLDPKHVKSRQARGATLHYIEGWQVIAEANRIFGFDGWDRETLSSNCVWMGCNHGEHTIAYTAKVRITVRAGETIIVREGSGSGEARAFSPGQAHELALKSAETDATKRALASFGNVFGLALYDPEQNGVKKTSSSKFPSGPKLEVGPWMLRTLDGKSASVLETPQAFAEKLQAALRAATNIDELYGIWEQNVATVRVSKTDADLPSRVRSIHGPTPRLDLRKLNTSWAAAGQAGGCRCALRQAHGEWRRLHCAKKLGSPCQKPKARKRGSVRGLPLLNSGLWLSG